MFTSFTYCQVWMLKAYFFNFICMWSAVDNHYMYFYKFVGTYLNVFLILYGWICPCSEDIWGKHKYKAKDVTLFSFKFRCLLCKVLYSTSRGSADNEKYILFSYNSISFTLWVINWKLIVVSQVLTALFVKIKMKSCNLLSQWKEVINNLGVKFFLDSLMFEM